MHNSRLFILLTTHPLVRIIVPLTVFFCILIPGIQQINQAPMMYKATARIWVQKSLFGGSHGSQPGEIPDSPLLEGNTNLNTFAEVVQSDAVLNLAFEELKTKLSADKLPARQSLYGIKAIPEKDANIISIEFCALQPEVSRLVISSVIKALLKENSMQIAGPLEETRERLNKQLDIARQEYNAAKDKLKQFEDSTGTVDFASEASAMGASRSDLEQQIDEANNELKALKIKIEFLQAQLGFGPNDVIAVEKIASDEVVDNLKKTIATTEVKLIELKSKFQEDHPRVKRLRAVLDDARKEMANRYATLIGKVDPKFEGINKESETQRQLLTDMVEANTEIIVGQSKVQSLSESLQELNAKMTMLPKKQQELADLQRQDELATNTLAAVESELQRVRLTESVSLSSSRLQVIDSGDSTVRASLISMPVLVVVSAIAAALMATLQYFIDPRVLSIAPLINLGFPAVGWFPRLGNGSIDKAIPHADRLRFAIKDWFTHGKIIWITSANDGDGKSIMARALSLSLADGGYRVVLIDANLNRPSLHLGFGVPASPGLLQYLQGESHPENLLTNLKGNLDFIPVGGVSSNNRLLSGFEFTELLDELEKHYDAIIVDGPAIGQHDGELQLPDSRLHMIISILMGHTVKACLHTLKTQIQVSPKAVVGMVVHGVKGNDVLKLREQSLPSALEPMQPVAQATTSDSSQVATW